MSSSASARLLFAIGMSILVLSTGCVRERYEASEVSAEVDLICPGDPSGLCDFSDDTTFSVGSAAVPITPTRYETWLDVDGNSDYQPGVDQFLDCGLDRLCPEDEGYPGPDEGEANDSFDALWLAGFQVGRPMQDAADDLWARATVFTQGETSIGIVSVDLVGFFYDEVLDVRATARAELGLDHVVVSSTHVHEAPDTMGIWGSNLARSGINPDFMSQVHLGIQDALREAQANAVPAAINAGSYSIDDDLWDGSGINNINIDTRPPHIVDRRVRTARFTAEATGESLGSWVNFANHPEGAGSSNLHATSDFAHTLRTTVEQGAEEGPLGALEGHSGPATYFQGACGGMMTPLRTDTIDLDGAVYSTNELAKAYAVGRVTGYHALQSMESDSRVDTPVLRFRTKTLLVPVENRGYHLLLNLGVIDRQGYNYDEDSLIDEGNQPDLMTEVSVIELGELSVLTLPGELLPELAIGGYDGSNTGPLQELSDPTDPYAPQLSEAPSGPYLEDLMPGSVHMIFGLANDEIGYFIPDYNYRVDESNPFLEEAPGSHYEETNSTGPSVTGLIVGTASALLEFIPPER